MKYFFLLFLFLVGCASDSSDQQVKVVGFSTTKLQELDVMKFSIKLSAEFNPSFEIFQSIETDSGTSLLLYDYNDSLGENNIILYNLSDSSYRVIGVYNKNKWGILTDFYYINKDSILLFNSKFLTLVNDKGKIIFNEKLNYNVNQKEFNALYPPHFKMHFNRSKKQIYFFNYSIEYNRDDERYFNRNAFITTYDMNEHALCQDILCNFPKQYQVKDCFYGLYFHPYLTMGKEYEIIYSFPISNFIFVINKSSNNTYVVPSNYVFDNPNPIEKRYYNDRTRILNFNITEPLYTTLHYDKYRDIYYRFVEHRMSVKNSKGKYNEIGEKNISLMILDSNFNIIDEIFLGNKKYVPHISFIANDGIAISTNNYLNIENKSLEHGFELFKIKLKY
jgi:hypothetical protein